MRLLLSFLILLLIGCSSPKQEKEVTTLSALENYDTLAWSGMLHFKDQNYEKSLSNFQEAFKIKPDENVSDYFYASAAALHTNKDSIAKDLIISAIQKTNASEDYFDSFSEFNTFRSNPLFSEIKADYSKYQADFFNNFKYPEIYKEIDLLVEKDQKVRTDGSSGLEMRRIDSLNITRLIEINKKYGWFDKQWLLLWHHRGIHREDNYVWNYFRPLINEKIEKGELRKSYWARFDDEYSMLRDNGLQIYGTYWKNYDQFPIENIDQVDSLRSTLGLPPLAYMHKVYDAILPEDYEGKLPESMYKQEIN
jgi:hypothetical protein